MIINIISLVLSALAVFVSLYAVLEARKNRKQNLKVQVIREHIKILQKANHTINDIPITNEVSTVRFKQIAALKEVIENYLLILDEDKYADIKKRFQNVYEKYEKTAGIKFNSFSTDLSETCALYREMDFPSELQTFYEEIKCLIENELRKKEIILSKEL